jgi:hypothetical protein
MGRRNEIVKQEVSYSVVKWEVQWTIVNSHFSDLF